ncbi:MAG TPA: ATP-dependent helicase [Solirubrobacteraceae bacterium]|jgi:DNA helicase-2/ATP-dependent DNA helicase PcrA|nr:ATP-dependent helicase [Solirubrobacteraceae bacterium]
MFEHQPASGPSVGSAETPPPSPVEGDENNGVGIDEILDGLNDEQMVAVTHPAVPLLVAAGAGTGKTRVLTRRVAWMVKKGDVQPGEVLAITFTNKAAREMRGRLALLCGSVARRIDVGTFHAMCAQMLRRHPDLIDRTGDFSIYDAGDTKRSIGRMMNEADRAHIKPDEVTRELMLAKNQTVSLEEYESYALDTASQIVARVWRQYEEELKSADALDFDDLLVGCVTLLTEHRELREAYQDRWKAVFVDEYQDTNPLQARLLRLLTAIGGGRRNLTAVGDDCQTIFGFRLSDPRLIVRFTEDYTDGQVVTLTTNYRSSPKILAGANRLIANNELKIDKVLQAAEGNPEGPDIACHTASDEESEAAWIVSQIHRMIERGIEERDIAVLARPRKVLRRVEQALAAGGISYERIGGQGFFAHKEIRCVIAHLRLLVNPRDEAAFETALEIRPQVKEKTVAKVLAYAEKYNLTLLEAAAAGDVIPDIHSHTARENVTQFAFDMLALAGEQRTRSVSSMVHEVIRMPLGVADAIATGEEDEQSAERLEALREAARTYERQRESPSLAGWLREASLADQSEDTGEDTGGGRVTVGTIHGVKGLEWLIVFGAGMAEQNLPSFYALTKSQIEEERRMAYVLETRAIRVLVFTYALIRQGRPAAMSRFIRETLAEPPTKTQPAVVAPGKE